jgi:hypothetical protein
VEYIAWNSKIDIHDGDYFEWLDESIEPCATSSDAIKFAEWLMQNNYKWEIDDLVGFCWYEENESGESKLYAAADLYKIYKSQTPSPTGDRDRIEELESRIKELEELLEIERKHKTNEPF